MDWEGLPDEPQTCGADATVTAGCASTELTTRGAGVHNEAQQRAASWRKISTWGGEMDNELLLGYWATGWPSTHEEQFISYVDPVLGGSRARNVDSRARVTRCL